MISDLLKDNFLKYFRNGLLKLIITFLVQEFKLPCLVYINENVNLLISGERIKVY